MTALADFLLARLDDDEAVAVNASYRSSSWDAVFHGPIKWGDPMPDAEVLAGGKPILSVDPEYAGVNELEHVVSWDPARVVAECETKRRIIEWASDLEYGGQEDDLLKLLALPYADHGDYREEWKL